MKVPIEHPRFKGRGLTLHTAGRFHGPRIILDGRAVVSINGCYVVRDNFGEQAFIKLKVRFLNPIPEVKIDDEKIDLSLIDNEKLGISRRTNWDDYLISALPFLLFFGGPLGVFIGLLTFLINLRVLRWRANPMEKVMLAFFISTFSFGVYLFIEALLERFLDIPMS